MKVAPSAENASCEPDARVWGERQFAHSAQQRRAESPAAGEPQQVREQGGQNCHDQSRQQRTMRFHRQGRCCDHEGIRRHRHAALAEQNGGEHDPEAVSSMMCRSTSMTRYFSPSHKVVTRVIIDGSTTTRSPLRRTWLSIAQVSEPLKEAAGGGPGVR